MMGGAASVGIDLGTTHSLVALYRAGKIEIFSDEEGEELLPSVVRYVPEGVIVGKQAKFEYENDPHGAIISAKRFLARERYWETARGRVSAVDVSADILKALMKRVHRIEPAISHAVITVPAYFDEMQRQATKRAAEQAGIEVLRLLNEPTAAAVAYGLDKAARGTCLVFDLGGGTFDVSILCLEKGFFEVLATGGDTALGGDDFDHLVMAEMGLSRMQARDLKEKLSDANEIALSVQQRLTRERFNTLIQPLVDNMFSIVKKVLHDAKISKAELDHVILVGGSSRIPYIQERVENYFQKKPLCSLDPEKVVAQGAAIQASILSGHYEGDDLLLLDVTPLSLGIEMIGGIVEKIIPRNTAIPAMAAQQFTTYVEGQTGLSLHIVQGERAGVEDCRSLAHFDLTGIPPMPAGKPRIEVIFRMDADGLLTVEAKELLSGVHSEIIIRANDNLTSEEVKEYVEHSLAQTDADRLKRQWRQKLMEAKQLLANVEKEEALFSPEEEKQVQLIKEGLICAMEGEDLVLLGQAIQALSPWAMVLAQRCLDNALQKALAGRSLDDLEKML